MNSDVPGSHIHTEKTTFVSTSSNIHPSIYSFIHQSYNTNTTAPDYHPWLQLLVLFSTTLLVKLSVTRYQDQHEST